MKYWSINGSISRKLKAIMVGLTVIVTLIAFIVLAYEHYNSNQLENERNLNINAQLIADYSVTTVIFNDPEGASGLLAKLQQLDNVVLANIFDTTGTLFVTYLKPSTDFKIQFLVKEFKDTLYYIDNNFVIIKPIIYKNTCYGYLQIVSTLDHLHIKFNNYVFLLIILLSILMVVTFILANEFQKIISSPILKLTKIASEISRTNDFSFRMKPIGTDEIASLYLAFNQMLDKLRIHQLERDIANRNLLQLNNELEERVSQRTYELKEALKKVREENTERKKAQEILSRFNSELEHSRQAMLEDATNLMALNKKLIESENKLTQMNETKDKFFSIIAHDLKNPLTAIMGSVDLLNIYHQRNDYEKTGFQLNRLKDGVLLFKSLLNNLLDWARTQSSKMEFCPSVIDINKMINDNTALNKAMSESKKIKVTSETDTSELFVVADANMMNTVIRNLLSNAIKFTSENGHISIKTYKTDIYATIEISDTGIGMSADDLGKLFRIDVNVASIGRSKEKGTGLGLIICKDFLTQHKIDDNTGDLYVTSEIGIGTTFSFNLLLNKQI